jgi:hypothetical protein
MYALNEQVSEKLGTPKVSVVNPYLLFFKKMSEFAGELPFI